MHKWQQLEQLTKELLGDDYPKIPSGSGSSKSEEDVVGETIICQCKQTENKNVSLLQKDLDRLNKNAALLEKFPMFITEGKEQVLLSIPVDEETVPFIKDIVRLIRIKQGYRLFRNSMVYLKRNGTPDKYRTMKSSWNKIVTTAKNLKRIINNGYEMIQRGFDEAWISVSTYDLFEGENNATE